MTMMTQSLKASDLNLLVELSCTNPQWEHVKFSFEDSSEEVYRYCSIEQQQQHQPSNSYYQQPTLLMKAVLVADEGYPAVVLYERVMKNDLSNTDTLVKCWEYYRGRLGHRMVEAVEGDILISTEQEEDNINQRVTVIYTLLDLKHYRGYTSLMYVLDLGNTHRHRSWFPAGGGLFKAAQVQAIKEYLRIEVPAHHRNVLVKPASFNN